MQVMERIVKFRPAFDKTNPDPAKNYGVGSVGMGGGVDYHSPTPFYEFQTHPTVDSCEWLDGKPCYSDGSALAGDELFQTLIEQGSDAVWAELGRRYRDHFGALE